MAEENGGATDGADETIIDDAAQMAAEAADDNQTTEVVEEEAPAEEVKAPLAAEEVEKRLNDAKGMAHQERQLRREAEGRAKALEERIAALEAAPATKAERPDPNADPIAFLEWVNNRLDEQEAAGAKTAEVQQQERAVQEFVQAIEADERAFAADAPDYFKAIEFIRSSRRQELIDLGAGEDNVDALVSQEFADGIRQAKAQGLSPARVAYSLAKSRGFEAGKGQAEEQARDKIAKIAQGQRATSPLAVGGGRGGDDLTVESVNNLKGAAFLAAAEKLEQRMLRQERGF